MSQKVPLHLKAMIVTEQMPRLSQTWNASSISLLYLHNHMALTVEIQSTQKCLR
jgi:hypothetical protein